MGFFNDLGKKTTETTNKIARETKLKMKITENKGKIKNLYEEIGKKVYENYIREQSVEIKDIISNDCENLESLSKEIEAARTEILQLNNKKLCNNCFAEIGLNAMFCSKCGKKQTEEKTVFEKAEEKLENADILPQNKKEAEIVKEELEEKNSEANN